LHDFLVWLEASGLGRAMRGTGVWTYGLVNLAHILGVASLFGAVLILDLRLLGCWRAVPLAALTGPTVRIARIGFGLAVATGVALLATKATEYEGNPFLWWIKFPAIALALVNILLLESSPLWKQHTLRDLVPAEHNRLRWHGAASLFCWLTAVAAGRMTAYW
jgi:hypothetical protein